MSTKKLSTEIFIARSKLIHPGNFLYSNTTYINNKTKLIITCVIHGDILVNPNNHLNLKSGCPHCYGRVKRTLEDFIIQSNKIHDNKYDYSRAVYVNDNTKIDIICTQHGVFTPTPTNHIHNKSGCPTCYLNGVSIRNRKLLDDFLIQASNIHNNKYDYSLVEYINNRTKIKIICPIHGIFQQVPNAHLDMKCGCPKCKSSKGETLIRSWLINNKVYFIEQHSFVDCKDKNMLRFDFYIPSLNILIEFNGIQHYRYIPAFHKNTKHDNFERVQQRDSIKKQYTKEKGITFVVIPFWDIDKIDQILTKICIS